MSLSGENKSSGQSQRNIYVYYNPKATIRVCLKFPYEQYRDCTLSQLISQSILILRNDYLLDVKDLGGDISLYPASKTGSRRGGYPELDIKLLLSKTNFRRFYLQECSKHTSMISTEYNLELKYGLEKKVPSTFTCCSLLRLLKA